MHWTNTATRYGAIAKCLHWTTAVAFIAAYVVVYYVIWFMDDTSPDSWPVLNVHWALGVSVGAVVLPRLLWRSMNVQPVDPPGSALEHRLAHFAHAGLYGLLILMPLTGYAGTDAPTDFGLFAVPSFRETRAFEWIRTTWEIEWEAFESPVDAVHHFVGKWLAWVVVALHVIAALWHHRVRGDFVLNRMLPGSKN